MKAAANIVAYLKTAALRVPHRMAFAFAANNETITFGALWERVDRVSTGLAVAGLTVGDRVICMVPMSLDLYVVLLGILKAGGVAVFVDPWIGLQQVAAFAAFAEPCGYVGSGKSQLLRLLRPELRRLPLSITTGRRAGFVPARLTLRELMARSGDGIIQKRSDDDPALITFTTGSSGDPKGVNRTHGFLRAQHDALRSEFPCADNDVDMSIFPVFALHNLAMGIGTVVPDIDFRHVAAVDAAKVAAAMVRYSVTTCTASPPFFQRLIEFVAEIPGLRPVLRRVLTGGAVVADEQLIQWLKVLPGTEIQVVYGSTEAEPVAHVEARERLRAKSVTHAALPGYCLGKTAAGLNARVIRITKGPVILPECRWSAIEVPDGEIGELIVTAPHVGRDYYRNPAAVAENKIMDRESAVWHRMGDTVYRDTDGCLWLVGRVHSTIWRAGIAFHPQLLEQAAMCEGVSQVAAVGLPDAKLGQRLVLVAYGEGPNLGRIQARLTNQGIPVDAVVASAKPLPLDPRHNAKIDYARLSAWLLNRSS